MLSHPLKQLLRSGSIEEKLRRINLLTTGSAFLVAILLLTTYDYLNLSSELLEDSQVKAQLIGRNSASALEFNDAKAAGEVLNSLEADAQVLHAALWDQAGQRLAVYRSAAQSADAFISHSSHGHELGLAVLDVAQPVSADGKPIGTIALRLDLSQLYQRLVWHALAFALVILIASREEATTRHGSRSSQATRSATLPRASTPCSKRSRIVTATWQHTVKSWKLKWSHARPSCARQETSPKPAAARRANSWRR
jgi:uncharacterized membrane protein affecting hemolysin expression